MCVVKLYNLNQRKLFNEHCSFFKIIIPIHFIVSIWWFRSLHIATMYNVQCTLNSVQYTIALWFYEYIRIHTVRILNFFFGPKNPTFITYLNLLTKLTTQLKSLNLLGNLIWELFRSKQFCWIAFSGLWFTSMRLR